MKPNRFQTYGIGEAVEMTGITQKQLRYWEQQGLIPAPERIVCGERAYRRYSEAHVKMLQEIRKNLDQGYSLTAAVRLAREKFNDGGNNHGDTKKQ